MAGGIVDKDSDPLFAGEFDAEETTNPQTATAATFASDLTAGAAGNYLLTVILYNNDNSLITVQGVYFELKENGYAGTFTPSQDYRDEILQAAQDAIDAATAASSDALVAEGYAVGKQSGTPVDSGSPYYQNNAKYFAQQSDNSAQDASAYANDAYNSALTSEGYAVGEQSGTPVSSGTFYHNNSKYYSQQAADSANTASEAASLVQNVAGLFQSKLNAGALYFENGSAENALFKIPEMFSLACVVSGDYSGTVATLGNGVLSASAGVISFTDGVDNISATGSADNFNIVFLIVSPTATKLIVNGTQANGNMSVSGTGYEFGSTTSSSGAISNIAIFNFDIAAAGAPYTLADYTVNKPVPPSLTSGTANMYSPSTSTVSDYALKATYLDDTNAFVNTDNDTLSVGVSAATTIDRADEVWIRAYYPFPIKVGDKIQIRCASSYRNPNVYDSSTVGNLGIWVIRSHTTNSSGSAATNQVLATPEWNGTNFEQTTIATASANYISFAPSWTQSVIPVGNDIPANTILYSFSGLEIRINGVLVKLENYTVQNGVTKTVFDVSGNANDATVSGMVAGNNDVSAGRLIDFIVAQNS